MPKKTIFQILFSVAIFLIIAGGLILSQRPKIMAPIEGGLDFSGVQNSAISDAPETKQVEMRDGHMLPIRFYGTPGRGPLLILLHGSGWHGLQFNSLARALSDHAYVVVPDLRGPRGCA